MKNRIQKIKTDTHLLPWQRTHKGLTWEDMPPMSCSSRDLKLLNFALFRRGLYDPDLEAMEPDEVEKFVEEDETVHASRRRVFGGREDGRVLVRSGRKRLLSHPMRGLNRGKTELPQPGERQRLPRRPAVVSEASREALARSGGRDEHGEPSARLLRAWLAADGRRCLQHVLRADRRWNLGTLERMARGDEVWLRAGGLERMRSTLKKATELAAVELDGDSIRAELAELIRQGRSMATWRHLANLCDVSEIMLPRVLKGVEMRPDTLARMLAKVRPAVERLKAAKKGTAQHGRLTRNAA